MERTDDLSNGLTTAEDSDVLLTAHLKYPLADLLRFYLPLAATSVLMMVTHSVVSGAIARTMYPTIALAAYSVSYSVGQVFESPCYAMQRICLTFTTGKKTFRKAAQVTLIILGALVFLQSLVTWTPLSRYVFMNLLGVSDEVYHVALVSLKVLILWPISSALRSIFQTPIVVKKQTHFMTINMLIRVLLMFVAAAVLPTIWPNGPVGASILMLGLSTEAVLAFVVSKRFIPPLEDEDPNEPIIGHAEILRFALPLVFASVVQTLGRPIIAAALSRTVNPDVSLAGYQVALSYSFIFTALTYNIYHLVIIFVKGKASFKQAKRFSSALGIVGLVCLLLSSLPFIGNWVFGTMIGAPLDTLPETLKTLAFVSFMPLMACFAEFYGGMLIMKRHTSWVTVAKCANVVITAALAMAGARLFPGMGGAIGTLAMAAGSGAEALTCYIMFNRFPECRVYAS
ncbi:MAG TPA: hypothetical protein PLR48_02210 [Bacillota bacterium]|nr:hypothetical protein [Bacillota bacterium]